MGAADCASIKKMTYGCHRLQLPYENHLRGRTLWHLPVPPNYASSNRPTKEHVYKMANKGMDKQTIPTKFQLILMGILA